MDRETLERLSKDELITLVLAQAAQIAALTERIAALEDKLGQPPKTSDNSSVPPSRGLKPNRAEQRKAKPKGRPGSFRALSETPDRTITVLASACPHCDHALSAGDQPTVHAYDHIDLPPIRPVVTRVLRHRGTCPCCRRAFSALVTDDLAPGSPFGPGIVALVVHLHVTQAIGFERLSRLMAEVFGLAISEGAISNMLARAQAPLTRAADAIAASVRASRVIASDETTARVMGQTWWQWVLTSSTAVYHLIADTRGARVVVDFLNGARPASPRHRPAPRHPQGQHPGSVPGRSRPASRPPAGALLHRSADWPRERLGVGQPLSLTWDALCRSKPMPTVATAFPGRGSRSRTGAITTPACVSAGA